MVAVGELMVVVHLVLREIIIVRHLFVHLLVEHIMEVIVTRIVNQESASNVRVKLIMVL